MDKPEKPDRAHTQSNCGSASGGLGTRPLSSVMRDAPGCLDELLPIMVKVVDVVAHEQRTHGRPSSLDPHRILLHGDGSVEVSSQSQPEMGKTFALRSLKYVSPELLQSETPEHAAAADSYVLGFLFYELLLGQKLFDEQFKQVHQGGDAGWSEYRHG